ncbi:MAG: 2-keto-4-pentenoate hydratase [Eubacteriaceae bacterium]
MNNEQIKKAADMLYQAEKTRIPVDLISAQYPEATAEDAYNIQLKYVERRIADDKVKIIGKKIGLTSEAMRIMIGVDEPDYGHLFEDMYYEMEVPIDISQMLAPRIESEIAFVLCKELKGPGVKVTDVIEATAGVISSFEIIDSRFNDPKIKFVDTVSDNGSSARVILGTNITDIKSVDLRTTGLVLEKNGKIIDTAAGAAVLGNPAVAVAWLANKLYKYGISLKPGEIILSGSLTKAYEIKPGDVFTATFAGLGAVKAVFK